MLVAVADIGRTKFRMAFFDGCKNRLANVEDASPIGRQLNLNTIVRKIGSTIQASQYRPDSVVCGIAAFKPDLHIQEFEQLWKDFGCPSKCMALSDAELALSTYNRGENGTLLICGSGSILLQKHEGEVLRLGGFGPDIGDPGSGKRLENRYEKATGVSASAKQILDAVESDTTAAEIVRTELDDLFELIESSLSRNQLWHLYGSLFKHERWSEPVMQYLRAHSLKVQNHSREDYLLQVYECFLAGQIGGSGHKAIR